MTSLQCIGAAGLPTRDRVDDVDSGAGVKRRIQPLQIAHVFRFKKDGDVGTKLAGLVTEIEAQTRILALQGVDHLPDRVRLDGDCAAVAGTHEKLPRNPDGNRRGSKL